MLQVPPEPEGCLFSERHGSFLLALPSYENQLLLEVHVGEVQVGHFLRAETGRVDELEERPVSQGERPVAFEILQERLRLGTGRRPGEPSAPLASERQLRDVLGPEDGPQERAYGGELAGDRSAGELAGLAAGAVATHLGRVAGECTCIDLLKREPALAKPFRELVQVAAVSAACRVGKGRARQNARWPCWSPRQAIPGAP